MRNSWNRTDMARPDKTPLDESLVLSSPVRLPAAHYLARLALENGPLDYAARCARCGGADEYGHARSGKAWLPSTRHLCEGLMGSMPLSAAVRDAGEAAVQGAPCACRRA